MITMAIHTTTIPIAITDTRMVTRTITAIHMAGRMVILMEMWQGSGKKEIF